MTKTVLLTALATAFLSAEVCSQEFSGEATIGLFTGLVNYQGDLKPNSFTFNHSNFSAGLIFRKPVSRWITLRAGAQIGRLEGADRYNRDYLKARNLDFTTSLKEIHAGLELTLLNIAVKRFTPYLYGGIAVFHFNPWTRDRKGQKVFLKPLSTEGQGLAEYPGQKPYNLTQLSIPFGGGIRYALSPSIVISVEFSQRKSFTDYIDDVSSHYINREILLEARGLQSADLAYRTDEFPGGNPNYPVHGEQRGTASEMDWYYFFGTTVDIKLSALRSLFQNSNPHKRSYQQRCPRNVLR